MQRDLLELTLTTLDDMKANAANNVNIAKLTSVSDFMIFSTGNSSKQVRSIANKIAENVKKEGHSIIGIEGYERS